MSDTLAHSDMRQSAHILQMYLQKLKLQLHGELGDGGIDMQLVGPPDAYSDIPSLDPFEASVGIDYESVAYAGLRVYRNHADRFDAVDAFVGFPLTAKFMPTYRTDFFDPSDGHYHCGIDGYGPKLLPVYIPASSGALENDTNAEEHIQNASIHNNVAADNAYVGVYTPTEPDEELGAWSILAGNAAVEYHIDRDALKIFPGTILRLQGNERMWEDRFTIEFDVAFQNIDSVPKMLHLHIHVPDAESTNIFFLLSASMNSGIYAFDRSTYTATEITDNPQCGQMDAGSWKHCRLEIYNNYLAQWLDMGGLGLLQTANASGMGCTTYGYLEIIVPQSLGADACTPCWISDLHISRNRRLDAIDIADSQGVIDISNRHAGTHYLGNCDEIDVTDLADRDSRLLHAWHRQLLAASASGDLHSHWDDEIDLLDGESDPPVVGGHANLQEHVEDFNIHSGIADTRSLPVSLLDTYYDGSTLIENKGAGSNTAYIVRADHSHIIPYWVVDVLPTRWDSYYGLDPNAHLCDSAWDESDPESQSEFLNDYDSPAIYPFGMAAMEYAVQQIKPTLDGSIEHTIWTPQGYYRNDCHYRYRMRLYASEDGLVKYFRITAYGASIWITNRPATFGDYTLQGVDDPDVFVHRMEDGPIYNKSWHMHFFPGYNDIYVYIFMRGRSVPYVATGASAVRLVPCTDDVNFYRDSLIAHEDGIHFVPSFEKSPFLDWWRDWDFEGSPYTHQPEF